MMIDHVTICYKNRIFIYPKHPLQKSDFSEQTIVYSRTPVDRPHGGSRPMCTNVHRFGLAVDRLTNQSTGLGDLELTWSSHSVRSTGSRPVLDRQCKAQSTGSRPVNSGAHALWPVDRQSTGTLPPSQFPVDRQSTGGRPIG